MSGINPLASLGSVLQGFTQGRQYYDEQQRQQAQDEMQKQLHLAQLANYQRQAKQDEVSQFQTLANLQTTLGEAVSKKLMPEAAAFSILKQAPGFTAQTQQTIANPAAIGSNGPIRTPSAYKTTEVNPFAGTYGAAYKVPQPKNLQLVDMGMKGKALVDANGTVVKTLPYVPEPKQVMPSYQAVTGTDDQGNPIVYSFDTRSGTTRSTGVKAVPKVSQKADPSLVITRITSALKRQFPLDFNGTSPAYVAARAKYFAAAGLPDLGDDPNAYQGLAPAGTATASSNVSAGGGKSSGKVSPQDLINRHK